MRKQVLLPCKGIHGHTATRTSHSLHQRLEDCGPWQGNMWRRKGWAAMDQMREKLEALKELRDLVRSLGRGGGWGPLRRAPVQVCVFRLGSLSESWSDKCCQRGHPVRGD